MILMAQVHNVLNRNDYLQRIFFRPDYFTRSQGINSHRRIIYIDARETCRREMGT